MKCTNRLEISNFTVKLEGAKAKLARKDFNSCMFARLCNVLVALRRVVFEALIPAMPKGTPNPVAVRC